MMSEDNSTATHQPTPSQTVPTENGQTQPAKQAQDAGGGQQANPAPAQPQPEPIYNIDQMFHYFDSGNFDIDVALFRGQGNIQTGYANLDNIQPLYPGLYILGAVTSLGKTTYLHQMADQLAASGQVVIYISLEQTRLELATKSLSRQFYLTKRQMEQAGDPAAAQYYAPSSIAIRRGLEQQHMGELQRHIAAYKQMVGNDLLIVTPTISGITVEDIEPLIVAVEQQMHTTPIVIVDYIQILQPSLSGIKPMEGRQAIDHIILTLKFYAKKHGTTIIAISALNRANYSVPVDLESFKESGCLEYTADVVWGLQLATVTNPAYIKEKDITNKRAMVFAAKQQIPRAIDLVCLKNRYGSTYESQYSYYPDHDLFVPAIRVTS